MTAKSVECELGFDVAEKHNFTAEEKTFLLAMESFDDTDDDTYGKTKLLKIPVDKIICLAQVRDDKNEAYEELKELIGIRLINNPDIGVMSSNSFEEYINFVNKVHGSSYEVEDFLEQNYLGYYCVAMAGNTRSLAMQDTLKKDSNAKKYVACKVDIDPSPEQILQIQIAENTYQKPKLESKIRALVEAYELGRLSGKWNNVGEFRNGKGVGLSRYAAEVVSHVTSLPPLYREFIYRKTIKANTGAALGWALGTVNKYHIKVGYGDEKAGKLSPTELEEVKKTDQAWLQQTVAHIQNEKLNGPAARKYIEGLVNDMRSFIDGDENIITLELPELTNGQMLTERRRQLERQSKQIILAIGDVGLRGAIAALELHQELHPDGQEIRTLLGKKAARACLEAKKDLMRLADF